MSTLTDLPPIYLYGKFGVLRGTILEPLLFVSYLNDIGHNLLVIHLLYADDMKIFATD